MSSAFLSYSYFITFNNKKVLPDVRIKWKYVNKRCNKISHFLHVVNIYSFSLYGFIMWKGHHVHIWLTTYWFQQFWCMYCFWLHHYSNGMDFCTQCLLLSTMFYSQDVYFCFFFSIMSKIKVISIQSVQNSDTSSKNYPCCFCSQQ